MKYKTAYLELILLQIIILIVVGGHIFILILANFADWIFSLLVPFVLYFIYLFYTNHNIDVSRNALHIEKALIPYFSYRIEFHNVSQIKVLRNLSYGRNKLSIKLKDKKGKNKTLSFRFHHMYEDGYETVSEKPTFDDLIDDLRRRSREHNIDITITEK